MQVLLLNASAKNDGATQEILLTIKKFVPNAQDANVICLGDKKVNYCKGCLACYHSGKCVQNDDMESIINEIDSSHALIIAAPSYWADIPGQFKVFIDHCTIYGDINPYPNHRVLSTRKKCYAIALRTGSTPSECENIIRSIRHWCGHMKIDMLDSILLCGIRGKDDIGHYKENICEKAQEWLAN